MALSQFAINNARPKDKPCLLSGWRRLEPRFESIETEKAPEKVERDAMKRITLVTGNSNKAKEIEALIGARVDSACLDIKEIQSLSVGEVAREKASTAYRALGVPVVVDDTGMNIAALGGLPGALVFWFLDTIGPEGILRLMRDSEDRRASVSTCIAYCEGPDVQLFEGIVEGTVSMEIRGTNGFGYDPIFIPNGQSKTYAEMTAEEKNSVSMRSIALSKLRDFLLQRGDQSR